MLIRGWRFLDSARINTIVQTLADQLEFQQPLLFLSRTPIVDADDDDIVGRFKGQVFAADIIADDQEAVVYESGSFEFVTNTIPNLKIGARVGQGMLNRLARLRRNIAMPQDGRFFTDWENAMAEALVLGVRQRMNALICAMQLDSLVYDRLGIKLTGGWGTPADLKPTVSVAWTDPVGSVPLTDVLVLAREIAPDLYGEQYNRITMSSKAFRYLINSNEFAQKLKGELRFNFESGSINTRDFTQMQNLMSNMLGMQVEIYDGTYWTRGTNGAKTRERVLPANKVILSNTADDNNREAMDFANGIVTESVVSALIGDGAGGIGGESFGPISYYTGDQDLNPPDIRAWAVARGFPRKHRETATAVLTVGAFS